MKIDDILKNKKASYSFEFFPPKTEKGAKELACALGELKELNPDFVSITNSPLSADPMKTAELATLIKKDFSMEAMAHLTCISSTKNEIALIAEELKKNSIKNVLALRGDLPASEEGRSLMRCDYKYANELVSDLAKSGFCIGVAGYPDVHPESPDQTIDIDNLKRKIDCGASFIITQLFFDNATFLKFKDKCIKRGITAPIIAGIMPITSYAQIEKFTCACRVELPKSLCESLDAVKHDTKLVEEFGINYAARQINELYKEGQLGIHFYTLNKSRATQKILKLIKR